MKQLPSYHPRLLALLMGLLLHGTSWAQGGAEASLIPTGMLADSIAPGYKKKNLDLAEINLLGNYYHQEGAHSAVTGGIGTEKLTDVPAIIIVNVPLDSVTDINFKGGFTYYTSASSDNIDYVVSSESIKEYRGDLTVSLNRKSPAKYQAHGINLGLSTDNDYYSLSLGGNWSIADKRYNRQLILNGRFYWDGWWMMWYPYELRFRKTGLRWHGENNKRQSLNLSATWVQVFSKRFHASLSAEWVYQHGLLSIPFYRIYFNDGRTKKIEMLPATRLKYPIGIRANYFVGDWLVLRSYYRFYTDSWGITAHTASFETPIKLTPFIAVYPFFRYHVQTGADYFQPFGQHALDAEYYTSDYDLSAFFSEKTGIGFTYAPLYGIGRFKTPFYKKSTTKFKSIDMRFFKYFREDGLNAWMVSLDMGFLLK